MTAIIIEDELPAREKLEALLQRIDPSIKVLAKLGSVRDSIAWLKSNKEPDLAFVDIQLSDDHSFEIFKKHEIKCPVIFTTAYDKYILESFEFNSIDYLLKPITEEKLGKALQKVARLQQHFLQDSVYQFLLQSEKKPLRMVVRKGTEFVSLPIEEIAYFFSEHKVTFVRDLTGRQLMVDKNLADLENELSATGFFRLNRKYLISPKAVEKFKPDNGRILVSLKPSVSEEVYVSKETAPEFRKWMSL